MTTLIPHWRNTLVALWIIAICCNILHVEVASASNLRHRQEEEATKTTFYNAADIKAPSENTQILKEEELERVFVQYKNGHFEDLLDSMAHKTGLYDKKSGTSLVYDFEWEHELVLLLSKSERTEIENDPNVLRVVTDHKRFLLSSSFSEQRSPSQIVNHKTSAATYWASEHNESSPEYQVIIDKWGYISNGNTFTAGGRVTRPASRQRELKEGSSITESSQRDGTPNSATVSSKSMYGDIILPIGNSGSGDNTNGEPSRSGPQIFETTEKGSRITYGIQMIEATSLWEHNIRGGGVKVCVVDSGLDATHPDFQPYNIDGYADKEFPWDQDGYGHGTHVTGTIVAKDGGNVVGVAPEASIYVVKVFSDDGRATHASSVINAAHQCRDAGVHIINMSLGGYEWNEVERQVFEELLYTNNILTIAAAGNEGTSTFLYPASYSEVLSVGAVDENKEHAEFSNSNNQVDIVAPGANVYSTFPAFDEDIQCVVCEHYELYTYGLLNGTSMAAPHVAGVAALLLSYKPDASSHQIREALESTAIDLGQEGLDDLYGHGLMNARLAAFKFNGNEDIVSSCGYGFASFHLEVNTDSYSSETSWELKEEETGIVIMETVDPIEDNQQYVFHRCIPIKPYIFTLFDEGGDGISTTNGGGYLVEVEGTVVMEGSNFFDTSVSVNILEDAVLDDFSSPDKTDASDKSLVCQTAEVRLNTDDFPNESSFTLIDNKGRRLLDVPVHSGLEANKLHTFSVCLPPNSCYTVTMSDRFGDGLCCDYGFGSFEVWYADEILHVGNSFAFEDIFSFGDNC